MEQRKTRAKNSLESPVTTRARAFKANIWKKPRSNGFASDAEL